MDEKLVLLKAMAEPFGIEVRLKEAKDLKRFMTALYRAREAMSLKEQISIHPSRKSPEDTLWIVHRAKETGPRPGEGDAESL